MKKRHIIILGVIAACLTAGMLFAQSVIMPGKGSAVEIIAVRKFAMVTMNSNLRDMRLKIKAGKGTATVPNARSIASIVMLLPHMFLERYEYAYPVKGSSKYFKGASAAQFQADAEYLNAQAQKLIRNASDKDLKKTEQLMNRMKKACVVCHRHMRGEYQ